MSRGKLAGITVACTVAVIIGIVLFIFKPWERTPAAQTYTLTIRASPSGACWGCPSGGEYESGRQLQIEVAPAAGYVFDYWSGDASGATPIITITMDSDKSLTANFRAIGPMYTLATSINPAGAGSVSPSRGEYESGEQVTLTASSASGYAFDHWSGSASGTMSTITVVMDSDKSLTANFAMPVEVISGLISRDTTWQPSSTFYLVAGNTLVEEGGDSDH
jgi:uncharacterized repeat protein (TIGR02543 family)